MTFLIETFLGKGWAATNALEADPFILEQGIVSFSMKHIPPPSFFEKNRKAIKGILINEWSSESADGFNLTCFESRKEHLKSFPVSFSFASQNMEAADTVLLIRTFPLFPRLRKLDISGNKIGLIGLGALGGGLMHTPLLEELRLRKVGAETINLRGRLVPASEDPHFGSLVKGLQNLKVLDLSENQFSNSEVLHFVKCLGEVPLLEELWMERIKITVEGLEKLLEGIAQKETIIRLFISCAL